MAKSREGARAKGGKEEPVVQFAARIPAELHRRLKVYAASVGTPINVLVAQALTALLNRRGAP